MGSKFIKNNTEYIYKKIDDWEDVSFAASIITFSGLGVVSIPFYVVNSLKNIREARTTCSIILRSSGYFTGGLLLTSVTTILCFATFCIMVIVYDDKKRREKIEKYEKEWEELARKRKEIDEENKKN